MARHHHPQSRDTPGASTVRDQGDGPRSVKGTVRTQRGRHTVPGRGLPNRLLGVLKALHHRKAIGTGEFPPGAEGVEGSRPHFTCPNQAVPVAAVDLDAALDADDPRAKAVCRSRALLYAAIRPEDRTIFEPSIDACRPGKTAARSAQSAL